MRKGWLLLILPLLIVAGLFIGLNGDRQEEKVSEVKGSDDLWSSTNAYNQDEQIEQKTIVDEYQESEDSGYSKTDQKTVLWENDEAYLEVSPHTCTTFHCEHEWTLHNKLDSDKTVNIGFVMPESLSNVKFYRYESIEKTRPIYQEREHSQWIEANETHKGYQKIWTEKVYIGEETYYENEYVERSEAFGSMTKDGKKLFYTTNYKIGEGDINRGKFVYDVQPVHTYKGYETSGKWEMYAWIGDYDNPSWSIKLDPWFNTTYNRRKAITIVNNQAVTRKNYQVGPEEGLNVTYDSDMMTGFQDLVFTWLNDTSSSEQSIGHWVEKNVSSTYAHVWVNIPDITASANETIYMYYSNSTAIADQSNGTRTFLWFDDFEDGNVSDWESTNSPTVMATNSTTPYERLQAFTCAGNGAGGDSQCWRNVTSLVGNTQQMLLHVGTRETVFSGMNLLASNSAHTDYEVSIIDNVAFEFKWSSGGPEPQIVTKSANTWYKVEMMIDLVNNNASARINNTFYANSNYNTSGSLTSIGIIELRNRASDAGHGDWDLFYIRNFTGTYGNQPTATFGNEETQFGWSINLNAPTNGFVNSTINGNTTFFSTAINVFNSTATPVNASHYSNLTGTFAFRRLNTTAITNNTQFGIMDQQYPEGTYIWNTYFCGNDGGIQCVFNATNFTYIVRSIPQWSNNNTNLSSPRGYLVDNIRFNVTWFDQGNNFNISLIEHNLTGNLTNYTMSNTTPYSNTTNFTYLFTPKPPAGNHIYRFIGNDTMSNVNASDYLFYVVSQNVTGLAITSSAGFSVATGTSSTIACSKNSYVPDSQVLKIDGVTVSNPTTQTFTTGTYNITCEISDTQNYSDSSVSSILTANALSLCTNSTLFAFEQNFTSNGAFMSFNFTSLVSTSQVKDDLSDTSITQLNSTRLFKNVTSTQNILTANLTGVAGTITLRYGNYFVNNSYSNTSTINNTQNITSPTQISKYIIYNILDEITFTPLYPPNSTTALFVTCPSGESYIPIATGDTNFILAVKENINKSLLQVKYSADSFYSRQLYPDPADVLVLNKYVLDAFNFALDRIDFVMDDIRHFNSKLIIYKPVNNQTIVITEGFFDASHEFSAFLREDTDYFLRVESATGAITEFGRITVEQPSVKHLNDLKIGLSPDAQLLDENILMNAIGNNTTIIAQYKDRTALTEWVTITIYHENGTIFSNTSYNATSDVTEIHNITAYPDETFGVDFTVVHPTYGNSPIRSSITLFAGIGISLGLSSFSMFLIGLGFLMALAGWATRESLLPSMISFLVALGLFMGVGILEKDFRLILMVIILFVFAYTTHMKRGNEE